jgi:uncharacterized protein
VLLDELIDKLRTKFGVSAQDASAIRAKLESLADLVKPRSAKLESVADLVKPRIVLEIVAEDPDDNRVLECAVAGRADYIVSGDKHLLKLKVQGKLGQGLTGI